MTTLRCSSLPLALLCPASTEAQDIEINFADEAAAIGSAIHHYLASRISGQECEPDEAASLFAVEDRDEVRRLCWLAWSAWGCVEPLFPNPTTEWEFDWTRLGLTLTGHIDVCSVYADEVRVLDWKTGYKDSDYTNQLRGYAWGALQEFGGESAYAAICWVRENDLEAYRWSRNELEQWHARMAKRLSGNLTYNPGRWCGHCPRGHNCPAKTQLLQQVAVSLVEDNEGGVVLPSDPIELGVVLGKLYDRAKLLEKASKLAVDLVRASVMTAGGKLPVGDGRELVIEDREIRHIDYRLGKEILHDEMGDDLDQAITVSKGKAEDAVRARCGRGQKAAAVRAFLERLEQAGALTTTVQQRLEVKRVVEQIQREAIQ